MESSRPKSARGGSSRRGRGNSSRDQDSMMRLSKGLSYVLRHGAAKEGLTMRPDGFVLVDDILALRQFSGTKMSDIEAVVRDNDKQRFALMQDSQSNRWLIRANQGHSLDVEVEMKPITDPAEAPVVVHGTYKRNLESILQKGLLRMNRKHIHFAAGRPGDDGVISGMRKNCDVLIYIDIAKAMQDGIQFLRSANNVILSEGIDGVVAPIYFSKIDEKGT